MLKVGNLQAGYGDSQVLFDLEFEIGAGEVVTLLGRNGMGKTTTVRTITGLLRAQAGQVLLDGEPIHNLPSFRIARLGFGLVPEGRQIFPNLSVRENLVATASKGIGGGSDWTFDRVMDLFPPLAERLTSMGNLLSGGEQQMLAISRALMTNPRLLILDEATEGLAPLVRADIWKVLEKLGQENLSILVIDKNVEALNRIADRHYVMERGRVVWQGSPEDLKGAPEIQRQYLGV
jgi:branched-chain amino acid transport system ATP-binding protein